VGGAGTSGGGGGGGEVLGADATVHARCVIGTCQEIGESSQYLGLEFGRQLVRSPNLADFALGPAAIAVAEQHSGKRQSALGADRVAVQKPTDSLRVALLLPNRAC